MQISEFVAVADLKYNLPASQLNASMKFLGQLSALDPGTRSQTHTFLKKKSQLPDGKEARTYTYAIHVVCTPPREFNGDVSRILRPIETALEIGFSSQNLAKHYVRIAGLRHFTDWWNLSYEEDSGLPSSVSLPKYRLGMSFPADLDNEACLKKLNALPFEYGEMDPKSSPTTQGLHTYFAGEFNPSEERRVILLHEDVKDILIDTRAIFDARFSDGSTYGQKEGPGLEQRIRESKPGDISSPIALELAAYLPASGVGRMVPTLTYCVEKPSQARTAQALVITSH